MNFYVTRAELFQLSHRLGWKFVVPTPPLTSSSFRKTELSWKAHPLSAPGDPSQSSRLPKAASNRCTLHNLGSHCSLIVQEHLQTQTPGGLECIH